jgi:hypothetical protein
MRFQETCLQHGQWNELLIEDGWACSRAQHTSFEDTQQEADTRYGVDIMHERSGNARDTAAQRHKR